MARRSPAVAAHQRQARVTVAPRAARRKELKGTAEEVVARATERAYPPLFCELSTRAVFSTYGKWRVRYRGGGHFPTLAAGRRTCYGLSAEGAAYTSLGQRPRSRPGTRQRAESPAQGFGSRAMDWPAARRGDGTGFQPFVPIRIVTWAVGPGWYSARQWRCRSPRLVAPKKPQESAGKLGNA